MAVARVARPDEEVDVLSTAVGQGGQPRDIRVARTVPRSLFAVAGVLAVLSLAVPNVHSAPVLAAPDSPVRQFFDVAGEANLPTWFNVVVLALGGVGFLLVALLHRGSGRRALPWAVTGLVLLALSLDDLASLHERMDPIGQALGGGSGALHFAWVVPGAVAGAVVLGLVGWLALVAPAPMRRDLVLGLGLLLRAGLNALRVRRGPGGELVVAPRVTAGTDRGR